MRKYDRSYVQKLHSKVATIEENYDRVKRTIFHISAILLVLQNCPIFYKY
jgi:hypothetical protein